MNKNVGIENIKKQLFSFEGIVDNINFFFASLIVLPILGLFISIISLLVYEIYLDIIYWHGQSHSLGTLIAWLLIFTPITIIFIHIFLSFIRRRLNDLKLSKDYAWLILVPIINVFFLLLLIFVKGVKDEENI
ncbi:hypothetical protein BKG92_06130 [Rodentibacter ratti]|uniref:DUF805 domain-containing protein n=1 Tax=Rodentibacter ratti TaxID=1906745 RepID=A0A1V3KYN7_9PAST|nr:DUF805 domain-containing protein [Rodentibacter ratti]OOF82771.1 hypothetical protein BKG92_06130 [Rodentibacter ratti]